MCFWCIFFLPANEDFDWWASQIHRDCRICNADAIPELKKTCQNLNSISSSISTSSSYSSWPKSASAAKSPSSTSPFLRTTPTFFLVPAMSMGETPLNFGLNQITWYSETNSISNYLRQIELTSSPTLALDTFLSIAMQWQASLLMFKSRSS